MNWDRGRTGKLYYKPTNLIARLAAEEELQPDVGLFFSGGVSETARLSSAIFYVLLEITQLQD